MSKYLEAHDAMLAALQNLESRRLVTPKMGDAYDEVLEAIEKGTLCRMPERVIVDALVSLMQELYRWCPESDMDTDAAMRKGRDAIEIFKRD